MTYPLKQKGNDEKNSVSGLLKGISFVHNLTAKSSQKDMLRNRKSLSDKITKDSRNILRIKVTCTIYGVLPERIEVHE